MNINDVRYGGKYHKFFWDKINPNATLDNGLANCTTLVYGLCLIDGTKPVSVIRSANAWHNYLINGWSASAFDKSKVKVGDIIEWVKNCHVARVSRITDGVIYVYASWYTGEHGKSIYNGEYDTRHFRSLEEMSDFFYHNYPTRFFHEWSLEDESKGVGGSPDLLLSMPTFKPTEKNTNQDQIEVLEDCVQNVRDNSGNIIGTIGSGFYNVYGAKSESGYIWYSIAQNAWVALVNGRVVYYPKENDLEKENERLKMKLRQIHELSGE